MLETQGWGLAVCEPALGEQGWGHRAAFPSLETPTLVS